MSVLKMLNSVPQHPKLISEALEDMKKFLSSFNIDISKLLKSKMEHNQK